MSWDIIHNDGWHNNHRLGCPSPYIIAAMRLISHAKNTLLFERLPKIAQVSHGSLIPHQFCHLVRQSFGSSFFANTSGTEATRMNDTIIPKPTIRVSRLHSSTDVSLWCKVWKICEYRVACYDVSEISLSAFVNNIQPSGEFYINRY